MVLLYAVTLVMMLYFLFIADNETRDSFYRWSTGTQLVTLLLTLFSAAALATAIFKHYRFIDLGGGRRRRRDLPGGDKGDIAFAAHDPDPSLTR